MSNYPKTEQLLSSENMESSRDERLPGGVALMKSWLGNTGTSNGERVSDDAVGDMIATRLTSLIEDSIQQVTSSKELLWPAISERKGSSEPLQQSRKQARTLPRKDELEAERQAIHQAACKVIDVLNDTMETLKSWTWD